jgi:dTDP-4-dehydrorhamnose 3,5-epimerase
MDKVTLDQIQITPLARISVAGGDVMHAMKSGSEGFCGFGEAYFSWIDCDAIKAWKLHQRMTMNLVVPVGEAKFVFFLSEPQPVFREECIGASNYARLTIPPGIWFGFQGLTAPLSLVLNIANIEHDPDEGLHKTQEEISYNWNRG